MMKIFKVLVSVSVKISNRPFYLYPDDIIICKEEVWMNIDKVKYNKLILKKVKYRISDAGFENSPDPFKELEINFGYDDSIYVNKRKKYLTIKNCLLDGYLEDITIEENRNNAINNILNNE